MNPLLKRSPAMEGTERIEKMDSTAPVSRNVVDAVATAEGGDPIDLPPLYDVIDPDALDALFSPSGHGPARNGGKIVFTYYGYEVSVTSRGDVHLTAAQESSSEAIESKDGQIG